LAGFLVCKIFDFKGQTRKRMAPRLLSPCLLVYLATPRLPALHLRHSVPANLFMVRYVRTLLLVWIASPFVAGLAQLADLTPRPELSPEQVVQFQVTALQHNDDPKADAGIERAFLFASPSNKTATGPLGKFARILKGPAYSPMINNVSSSIIGSNLVGDQARVAIKVVAASGRHVTYVFVLSKQSEGEFSNCWMTDSVLLLDEGEDSSDQGLTI
jgi:hypothetical protein